MPWNLVAVNSILRWVAKLFPAPRSMLTLAATGGMVNGQSLLYHGRKERTALFEGVDYARNLIDKDYSPSGYNIGVNGGSTGKV